MGDWTDLIPDLLLLIARRIDLLEDFIAFGAVCRSWRLVAARQNFNGSQQVPWLMLDAGYDGADERSFVSLTKSRRKFRRVTLPVAKNRRCLESLGWLVTVSEDGEMNLLHPLSRRQIGLPHLSAFKNYEHESRLNKLTYIQKAVLSSSPSKEEEDYVLMVIYGFGFLGFWRPGDETWTAIETPEGSCVDVTYHNGKLYGIDTVDLGSIFVCDVSGPNPTLARVVEGIPSKVIACPKSYIVESAGRLLIVVRDGFQAVDMCFGSKVDPQTIGFLVFEIDLENKRLTEMNNLGDNALFLDENGSISVEASKFPGIRANCIYYTDECWVMYSSSKRRRGINMFICNLEDRSRTPYRREEWFDHFVLPSWVRPSF